MSTVATPLEEASSRLADRIASLTYAFPAVMGVAVVHMADDAIVNRPAGTSVAFSTGKTYEKDLNDVYYKSAGNPKTLWNIPNAAHTGGLSTEGKLYERRVVAFLTQALERKG